MATAKKRWVFIALGVVFVVVILAGLAGRDQAPQVQITQVTRHSLSASISSNGRVEPVQPYIMHAQLNTFVQQQPVVEGQNLRAGQIILKLDTTDAQAQLAQARADLVTAQEELRGDESGGPPDQVAQLEGDLRKAQLDVANLQRTHDALVNLIAEHAATQDELAKNQLALQQAQSTVQTLQQRKTELAQRSGADTNRDRLRIQQAQEQIKSLQEKIRSSTLSAPVDGTLYSLAVHTGDYVTVGEILAAMADLHKVRVRAYVDEPDLGSLAVGQPIQVTWDARPGRVWAGQTEQVPKQVILLGSRSVGQVLCSVDNSQLELLPNVNVDVRIAVHHQENALVVPRGTVHSEGSQHYVFLIDGNHIHRRDVAVGIANANEYAVLSGLSQGDRVVLPDDVALHDGMEVRGVEGK